MRTVLIVVGIVVLGLSIVVAACGFVYFHQWVDMTITDPAEIPLRHALLAWCLFTPLALLISVPVGFLVAADFSK